MSSAVEFEFNVSNLSLLSPPPSPVPATFPFFFALWLTYELLSSECASLFRSHLGSALQNPSGPLRRSGFHERSPAPPSFLTYIHKHLPADPLDIFEIPHSLPSIVCVFEATFVDRVKVGCSAKINPGGIVAPTNVGYMSSLARSSTRVEGHTWTFVAICLLSLVLPSGASLSPGGGPLPLGEWQLYNTPHLFSKQRRELERF